MRALLNTLFVTAADSHLSLKGETVVVSQNKNTVTRIPLHNLEMICCFNYSGASPQLMYECTKRNIALLFLSPTGKFLAKVSRSTTGNVHVRKTQYRYADCEETSCSIARLFIFAKVTNQRLQLERIIRQYPARVNVEKLQEISHQLQQVSQTILATTMLDTLRGIEGQAARMYFSTFPHFILNQQAHFPFTGRNRRPPKDNVNTLLSFCYTLLANDVTAALEAVGLDAAVGFLHQDRPARPSLALDMMEELRCVIVDRFVLKLINKKMIQPAHFIKESDGAVTITPDGLKIILHAWQSQKRTTLTHPFLKEKIEWGLVPYVQAMLLARFLRGELDAYPPFLWR